MAEGNLKYPQLLKIMGLIEAKTTSTTGITPYVFPGKKKLKCLVCTACISIILVVTCDNCEHTWTLCHKSQLRQIIGKEGKNKKWNDNPNYIV